MKSSFLILSILTVATSGIVDAQQAKAERPEVKDRSARWDYAPNVWKVEKPRVPNEGDGGLVRQGAMPRSGQNFLGLDPSMVAPRPQPVKVAKPLPVATSQISHKVYVPTTTAFKPDFGKPVQPIQAGEPMRMATLPPGAGSPIPQMAAAPPTANKAAAPAHHATSSTPHHVHTAVSGKLHKPTHAQGEHATPQVAAYSQGQGYVPGGNLPAQSGAGMNVKTNVAGKVVNH